MSAGVQTRAVRGARAQSLFYRDLGVSPTIHNSSSGGDAGTPNQVTAALWRENHGGGLDPPPPPFYTLEDRIERSPESNTSLSFDSTQKFTEKQASQSKTFLLPPSVGGGSAVTSGENQGVHTSSASPQPPQISGTTYWWSPLKERISDSVEAVDGDGKGPVAAIVQPQQSGGLLTLSSPGEIVRPDFLGNSATDDGVEGEGWVTVFGFGVDETNSVMREFEKCGRIINNVPGPGGANWVHLQYLSHYDAQKALQKNGIQLNGALIVGVKRLDPLQCRALTETVKYGGLPFTALPPRTPSRGTAVAAQNSARSHSTQATENRGPVSRPLSVIASPAKSTFSKFVDLVFGM